MEELAIVREIDLLEDELLDIMNHRNQGDDCEQRLTLKQPSIITPSEYHTQLKEYTSLCRQQAVAQSVQTATNGNSRHNVESNSDDVITIVTK